MENIRAFLMLAEGVGTSGMPRAEQFADISAAGFKAVINLALPTSDNALANEGDLVTRAGMTYVHLPVLFDAPRRADYERFERIMDSVKSEPVFVHCAANMRVSAFMFLYRMRNSQIPREVAEADLHKIWRPDNVWTEFIDSVQSESHSGTRSG
ncbi:MAG: protein tyrosine phosphatase family protein [Limisphaerales bacterium]